MLGFSGLQPHRCREAFRQDSTIRVFQADRPVKHLPQRVSLVAQTVALLKDEIKAGRWARQMPGEHELCALLHVGRVTVRSALSQLQGEGWVRTSQGRRCEIISRRRARVSTASDRVVLLSPVPLQNLRPFTVFWIDGLREHLAEEGYHLEIHDSQSYYTGRPENALESLALRLYAAGWVISQSTVRMQQWFAQRAVPCVITGSRHANVALPSVDRDYRAISRHAAGALLSRGHRRLALISLGLGLAGDLETEQGFQEGVQSSPASDAACYISRPDDNVRGICGKVEALLRHQRPTGFLVSRPNNFLTVMTYLTACGIQIPTKAALISRDNDSFLESVVPSVARYKLNPSLFARTISNLVVGMVRSGVVDKKEHRIMPEFVSDQTLG